MGLTNRRSFWGSLFKNDDTFIFYYNRLKELAISMFEWKNLPDTIDERFLELLLFDYGSAIFFKDDVIGDLVLQYTNRGKLDLYRVPIYRRAFGINGYSKELDNTNSVIIYNNMLKTNTVKACTFYARKLWNIDMTFDINIHAQKTPIVIVCDENQKLTFENLYKQYIGNEPVIFGSKDLDVKSVQVLNTQAPWLGQQLLELKNSTFAEALTYLGISNTSYVKKERMLKDEIIRNQGGTYASRNSRLIMRQKACDEINEMFGTNISVEIRKDLPILENDEFETTGLEGRNPNE